MQPLHAALATLLVPGSGHFAIGRPVRGAVALLVTVGMFVVGYAIIGQQMWYFQIVETKDSALAALFKVLPISMLPECPNLGCTIVASFLRDTSPEMLRLERMPVPYGHLGALLTGASGLVNLLWATDVYWLAQGRQPAGPISPARAAAISWLLPGAGHALAGQRDKGVLLGAAVVIVFAAGMLFASGHAVDRMLAPAWYDGQILCGFGVIFGSLVTAPLRFDALPAHHDLGVTLCTVAGFMNLLVMTNAYTVAEDGPDSFVEAEAAR